MVFRSFLLFKKPIAARLFAVIYLSGTAQAQVMSEDDAVSLALQRPENLAVIEAPVEAAEGALTSARTWRNPVFSYEREGVDGLGGSAAEGAESFYSLQRDFDISGRRRLEKRSAGANVAAAKFGAVSARQRLKAEASRRFYDVVAAEAQLERLRILDERLEGLESQTDRRRRSGDASQYELERVRQEAFRMQPMLAQAETDLIAAKNRLGALIGSDALAAASAFEGDLIPPLPSAYGDRAGQTIPQVAQLGAAADAADLAARAAGRAAPDITLGAGVRTFGARGDDTGILLNLSVPLPLFDRNQGEHRAASARAREARARYRLQRDALEAERASLSDRAARLRASALIYRDGALASAGDLARIATASFNAGEISMFEALDALNAAADTEERAIDLARDAREAAIALKELSPETE